VHGKVMFVTHDTEVHYFFVKFITDRKYERMDVHWIYAKNSLSSLRRTKVNILFLGVLRPDPTGALPLDSAGQGSSPAQIPEIWTPATPLSP